jgi:hypothetical protein
LYGRRREQTVAVHLRDLGVARVEAQRELAGVATVQMCHRDIFSRKPGPVAPGDPVYVTADAIESTVAMIIRARWPLRARAVMAGDRLTQKRLSRSAGSRPYEG